LTDPPYGTIENRPSTWKTDTSWDFVLCFDRMWKELERIVRPNGAVILFGQDPFTNELVNSAIPSIPYSYRCIWEKDGFANHLMVNKAPLNYYEDINFFFKVAPKHDFGGEHPLREYMWEVRAYIKDDIATINKALGNQMSSHYFTNGSQFAIPTERNYEKLIEFFGIDEMDGFRDWADLKAEDEAFRADLIKRMTEENPKVFNLGNRKHIPNIFKYKRPKERFHPTQKPTELLEELICIYSNEGDTVLDFTMGSGSTGVACVNTNRDFIGIELDEGYFTIACKRIKEAQSQGGLF
jgi:DNA modification methylase